MAEPRRDPETGGRSLAEILREAGIESPTRGRRRRDDPDDTGLRQRRAEPEDEDPGTGRVGGRPYGRRAGDLRIAGAAAPSQAADPQTAAIPGVRPSGKPEVPAATGQTGVVRERRADDQRAGGDRRHGDRRVDDDRSTGRVGERRQGDRRLQGRRLEDRRAEDRPDDDRATGRVGERRALEPRPDRRAGDRRAPAPPVEQRRPERVPAPATPLDDNPSTGPIPVVADERGVADAAGTPQEGVLAWLRFGGELVIALAAGVGIYFLFTVIWETLPHLAVLVAPLAVTGLVAGVGAYRHKMSRDPVGPRLLAVLVFAGVLLTVAPAAALLATG
ncbi:hypothetical protein [Geodermatophilus sp. SYSU D00815]